MSEFKNFKNADQRTHFFQILGRFGKDFLFLALIVFGSLWLMGVVGSTNHNFICDAEKVYPRKKEAFFFKDGNYFSGGEFQSQDFAYAGKSSLKLENDGYGFQFEYEHLKGNEEIILWVWRYAEGDWKSNGKVVATAPGKFWKASEQIVETKENGWERILLQFRVPEQTKNEVMQVYCWNPEESLFILIIFI